MEDEEYLVRGAMLECSCGSVPRQLNVRKCHGIYITGKPMIHELDCEEGETENIPIFGLCTITQAKCMPNIANKKWLNTYNETRIVDNGDKDPLDKLKDYEDPTKGYPAVTTKSFLVCTVGGLIEPKNSGQEPREVMHEVRERT